MRDIAKDDQRAAAMWERYAAGESLRIVGLAFGVRAQTVHAAFRVRGWIRRNLSDAQILGGDRLPQRQLLATLIRLRTACAALNIEPAECDRTLESFDPEDQARIRVRAQQDLVTLLAPTRQPIPAIPFRRAQ